MPTLLERGIKGTKHRKKGTDNRNNGTDDRNKGTDNRKIGRMVTIVPSERRRKMTEANTNKTNKERTDGPTRWEACVALVLAALPGTHMHARARVHPHTEAARYND